MHRESTPKHPDESMKRTMLALICLIWASLAHAMTLEEATKGAQRGDPIAEHALGTMLFYGQGVSKTTGEAIEWFGKAAEQGDKDSQFDLGVITYNGTYVPQDYAKALALFAKAAAQGHPDALYNLGVMYQSGQGTREDHRKAFDLFSQASDLGVKHAQLHLCGMYVFGDTVSKDYVLAYKWCLLSDLIDGTQLKGNVAMASEDHTAWIQKQLTPSQLAEAQGKADTWLAQHGLRRVGVLTYPLTKRESD